MSRGYGRGEPNPALKARIDEILSLTVNLKEARNNLIGSSPELKPYWQLLTQELGETTRFKDAMEMLRRRRRIFAKTDSDIYLHLTGLTQAIMDTIITEEEQSDRMTDLILERYSL